MTQFDGNLASVSSCRLHMINSETKHHTVHVLFLEHTPKWLLVYDKGRCQDDQKSQIKTEKKPNLSKQIV